MDTDPKYRNDPKLEVALSEMTDGHPPDHHLLNDDVPIDGLVHILFREPEDPDSGRDTDGRWYAGSFPFRDHRDDDHLWAAFPDKPNGKNHPVWKWKNPEEPTDQITLDPSIGMGHPDLYLHCWIKRGDIEWL